jgi:hypothetical protein
MNIFLIVITIIVTWMIFVRIYNHYYNKTNSIKIIGFRIENNQPCILIKYHTWVDNAIIKFHVYEKDKLDDAGLQQADKGTIILHFPTNVRPPCRFVVSLITIDEMLLAQDTKIYYWGWENK